jgi:hypothetical protein
MRSLASAEPWRLWPREANKKSPSLLLRSPQPYDVSITSSIFNALTHRTSHCSDRESVVRNSP